MGMRRICCPMCHFPLRVTSEFHDGNMVTCRCPICKAEMDVAAEEVEYDEDVRYNTALCNANKD